MCVESSWCMRNVDISQSHTNGVDVYGRRNQIRSGHSQYIWLPRGFTSWHLFCWIQSKQTLALSLGWFVKIFKKSPPLGRYCLLSVAWLNFGLTLCSGGYSAHSAQNAQLYVVVLAIVAHVWSLDYISIINNMIDRQHYLSFRDVINND